MHLTCPQCGTVYDVTEYPQGHTFECSGCGRTLTVGAAGEESATPATPPTTPPPPSVGAGQPVDTGLEPPIKVLLFFLNLCFTPLVGLVWWLIIRQDKPRTAREVCTWTWIPAVIAVVLWGLYFLFMIGIALNSH